MTPTAPSRRLVVLRHAKAEQASPDHARRLTERGRVDAVAAGRWLLTAGLVPDLVLCSPATRARQTWEHAASAGDRLTDVEVWPEPAVYQADATGLIDVLRGAPDDAGTVLLVGHNPGVAAAVAALADPPDSASEALAALDAGFPTCTLAVLHPAGPGWADLAPETARLAAAHTARG